MTSPPEWTPKVTSIACNAVAFGRAIEAAGGLKNLHVMSSYTFIDDPGHTPFGPGTHIFTRWGDADGNFVCEHEQHNDEHTYRIAPERQS